MKQLLDKLGAINPLGPWLAAGLLVALSIVLPNRIVLDSTVEARQAEISAAMQSVPFFVGEWIGRDEEVSPAAQQLLRPNAILSRTFRRPGEAGVHVMVVHCSDARDMIGHYPPICYPSAGWVMGAVQNEAQDVMLPVGDDSLPLRTYIFRKAREHGGEQQVRIFSTFILPDGSATRHIEDVSRQSGRPAISVQGVAQVQIITFSRVSREEALQAAGEVLGGMQDLFAVLGVTADHTQRLAARSYR
jgi:hypothetical protein